MPCVSGRAEMSSARDAVVVRAFRRECGILTLFNGSDGIHLAYAAYFGPFSPFQLTLFNLGSFSPTYANVRGLHLVQILVSSCHGIVAGYVHMRAWQAGAAYAGHRCRAVRSWISMKGIVLYLCRIMN